MVGSFFQDDMDVRATITKAVDGDPARMIRRPVCKLCGNLGTSVIDILHSKNSIYLDFPLVEIDLFAGNLEIAIG